MTSLGAVVKKIGLEKLLSASFPTAPFNLAVVTHIDDTFLQLGDRALNEFRTFALLL